MINFGQIIQRGKENDAYLLGVDAFYNGTLQKKLVSPFEPGSEADTEWFDGFEDAYFVHYGELINGTRD